MIIGTQYVSFAVEDVSRTSRIFRDLFGLRGRSVNPDPFLGTDKGTLIALPNEVWLYVVGSQQSGSPIAEFLERKGPGLERLALRSDNIEEEFGRVVREGVQLAEDALVDTPLGRRFVLPAEYTSGIKVEVIQPTPGSWETDVPDSISGILGLQHIGAAVEDFEASQDGFERLLDLHPFFLTHGKRPHMALTPGNDYHWVDVADIKEGDTGRLADFVKERGFGLEHICFEVSDIAGVVARITEPQRASEALRTGAPVHLNKIYTDRVQGFEAFVYPEHTTGVTVELVQPYPTSPTSRYRWR